MIMKGPLLVAIALLSGCVPATPPTSQTDRSTPTRYNLQAKKLEKAIFAGGCFWGLEYRFRQVKGVTRTMVGYTGGHLKNPNYQQVCSHTTGHAEAVLVEFDPAVVSYRALATLFFGEFHNPTQLNRQGPDVGDSYRSAVFCRGDDQESVAKDVLREAQKGLKDRVCTEIVPASTFWPAEVYHQNYIERTGRYLCPIEPPVKLS